MAKKKDDAPITVLETPPGYVWMRHEKADEGDDPTPVLETSVSEFEAMGYYVVDE